MLHRYGFNGSHIAYQNSEKFEQSEINAILRAIRSYPSFLFPLKKISNLLNSNVGLD